MRPWLSATGRNVVAGALSIDLLGLYLIQIRSIPLLSAADEQRLGRLIERGRSAARALEMEVGITADEERGLRTAVHDAERAYDQFVRANLALVVSVAKRYRTSGLPLLDLIQEGNVGLLHAVEKFDHTRGIRFSTYGTWWIRQAIETGVGKATATIHLPERVHRRRTRLYAIRSRLEVELGRAPTSGEVAEELGVTATELREVLALPSRPLSISSLLRDGDAELGSVIADPAALCPEEEAARSLFPQEVGRLLSRLDERERRILTLRFGLHDGEPRTLQDVARTFDVTPERVRQIEARALEKLRRSGGGGTKAG